MTGDDVKRAKARFDFKQAGGTVTKCDPGDAKGHSNGTFTNGAHKGRARSSNGTIRATHEQLEPEERTSTGRGWQRWGRPKT